MDPHRSPHKTTPYSLKKHNQAADHKLYGISSDNPCIPTGRAGHAQGTEKKRPIKYTTDKGITEKDNNNLTYH